VTRAGLPGDGLERIAAIASLRIWTGAEPPTVDQLAELVHDSSVLLCVNGDPVTSELLERCRQLSLVALATAGYDSVDVEATSRLGIRVTNTPGVLDDATADLAFALILAARRRVAEADRYVREGRWTEPAFTAFLAPDVHSSRLGLIGYGGVGRAVARRAQGFGIVVRHHTRSRHEEDLSKWLPLDELLRTSDIVSLHVPLTPDTRGLIGEPELRLMKSTATLVNTSRGAVADEAALARALREGWIHSAGLDVRRLEPTPRLEDPLASLENCVLLPHIASATHAARVAMADLAVDNVLAYLAGHSLLSAVADQGHDLRRAD
jgi:lactate dehydrogenase-like 2-hydroxyacid dehydrogenase